MLSRTNRSLTKVDPTQIPHDPVGAASELDAALNEALYAMAHDDQSRGLKFHLAKRELGQACI